MNSPIANRCIINNFNAGGDIHGQFYDLVELFKVGGDCPKVKYIALLSNLSHTTTASAPDFIQLYNLLTHFLSICFNRQAIYF